jgi:hypothetical protein
MKETILQRQTTVFVLLIGLTLTVPIASATPSNFGGGDGSEANPYQVNNWTQLDNIRSNLNSHFILTSNLDKTDEDYVQVHNRTENYSQDFTGEWFEGDTVTVDRYNINSINNATISSGDSADVEIIDSQKGEIKIKEYLGQTTLEINYTSQKGWKAIGNTSNKFTGEFDGQGHKIKGIRIDRPGGSAALFNETSSNAVIENLNLEGINYRGKRVGGLVANNHGGKIYDVLVNGYLENIDQTSSTGGISAESTNKGYINSSTFSGEINGYQNIGGISGRSNKSNILNSTSDLNITDLPKENIGGLVGNSTDSMINNSYSELRGEGRKNMGGLIGKSQNDTISYSNSTINISGAKNSGGLVGILDRGFVNHSNSKGSISSYDGNLGGLVGKSNVGEIYYSDASVEMEALRAGDDNIGGLIGYQYGGETYRSSSNSTIDGHYNGNERVGGLIGFVKGGNVFQSYSTGNLPSSEYSEMAQLGGLVGRQEGGIIRNSYSTSDVGGWRQIGGLVGYSKEGGVIENSYSTGSAIAEDNGWDYDGGLIATWWGDEEATTSYWNTETSNEDGSKGGRPRDTSEMTWSYSNTYENWDFGNVWRGGNHSIVTDNEGNTGYPALQWQESVNLTVNISGNSTVKVDGDSVGDGWSRAYGPGDEVGLEAVPGEYWYFDRWSGDIDRAQKSISVTLDEDKNVTAVFEEAEETYIELNSNASSVVVGEAVSFSADVYDQYGNLMREVTDDVSWSIVDSAGGRWSDNVYTSERNGSWTVTGNYDGLSNTSTLDVQTGSVDRVSLEPDTDQSLTAGNSLEFSAEAFDSEDNLITSSNTDFTWSGADEGIFDNTEAREYNVSTNYNGVSNDTNVTVNPASVSIVDATAEKVRAGQNGTISVKVEDTYGNAISGEEISIDTDGGLKGLEGSSGNKTDGEGKVEFYFNETESGLYNLGLSSEGDSVTDTVKVNVKSAEPAEIVFNQQPSDIVAGEKISSAINIGIEDQYDNLVLNSTKQVSLSVDEGPGSLKGTRELSFDEGTALFDNIYIERKGEYRISAKTSGVNHKVSDKFNVNSGKASQFNVDILNDQAAAGENTTIEAKLTDKFGNPIQGNGVNVDKKDGINGIGDSKKQTNEEGITNFYFNETDSGVYNLELSTDSQNLVENVKVNVSSSGASQLTFSQQPTDTTAGDEIKPAVKVALEDKYGNLVKNNTGEISVNTVENYGSLIGTTSLNFEGGTAVFDDISIEKEGEYRISDMTSGVNHKVSGKFDISSADVTSLDIEVLDSNEAGKLFNATVEGFDEFGNPTSSQSITDFSVISEHEGEIYSEEDLSFNESGKIAIEDLNLTVADSSHRIEVNASTVSRYSTELAIKPSEVSYYNFSKINNQTSGEEFTVAAEAYDEYDNLATNYYDSTDLSDASGSVSPKEITFSSGKWTGKVSITEAVNNTQLEVTGDSNSAKSNEFDVSLFEVSIDEGINTVSFPTRSGRYDLNNFVYNGLKLDNLTIWSYQDDWERMKGSDKIRGGVGYIIRSEEDGSIGVTPQVLESNGNKPSSVTLSDTEWNLIGHYETSKDVSPENIGENGFYRHNLDNVNSSEVKYKDYRQLINGYEHSFSSVNQFDSGEGYWVTVNWERAYVPVIN